MVSYGTHTLADLRSCAAVPDAPCWPSKGKGHRCAGKPAKHTCCGGHVFNAAPKRLSEIKSNANETTACAHQTRPPLSQDNQSPDGKVAARATACTEDMPHLYPQLTIRSRLAFARALSCPLSLSEGKAAVATQAEFEATPLSESEETRRRLRSPRAVLLAPGSGHLRRRRCRRLGKFASAPAWGYTPRPRQGCLPSPPSCACAGRKSLTRKPLAPRRERDTERERERESGQ